VTNV
jgi:hypothetical protein